MKTSNNNSFEGISIKAGIIMCMGYIAYFMLMKYMSLLDIVELRGLNFLILGGGLFLTYRYYKLKTHAPIDYIKGFSLGTFTSLISVALFAIFIYIYFSKIDPPLLEQLRNNSPLMGQYLTPFSAAFTIILEGGISGLVISFAIMQYYKNDPTYAKQEGEKNT